jgi:hypothetical protein
VAQDGIPGTRALAIPVANRAQTFEALVGGVVQLTAVLNHQYNTVPNLGGWSSATVVQRHYTGDISEVHRKAMDLIAGVG